MKNFLLKIIRILLNPFKIPKKIIYIIRFYIHYNKYNQEIFEREQNNIFQYFNLNRKDGLKNLINIKEKLEFNLRSSDMSSEHEVFFSSLSLSKNKLITDILEIGTFDGFNSLLLSSLFTNSNVHTIDLSETEDEFINFYNRGASISEFIKKRNIILSKNKNISFLPLNSLKLLNYKKKYDLIWIDGAHGYPVVCIDIINSLHILKANGLILCDDIYIRLNQNNSDKMYNSIASYETLKELKKQNLINFQLIYKRLHAKDNCMEDTRKFVAIVSKI